MRVGVPRQSGGGARSLNTETLEFFADTYEAVFRKADPLNLDGDPDADNPNEDDRYYRGEGDGAKGYISVPVPVGG
ncbi:MAG: hypothetical protein LBF60_03690, partial [Treponema sp.]|nr:hypothetical protein [Treponema sp.]